MLCSEITVHLGIISKTVSVLIRLGQEIVKVLAKIILKAEKKITTKQSD